MPLESVSLYLTLSIYSQCTASLFLFCFILYSLQCVCLSLSIRGPSDRDTHSKTSHSPLSAKSHSSSLSSSPEITESLLDLIKTGDEVNAGFLLDSGSDVNALDEWNATPLMLACQWGRLDFVNKILSKPGVDVHAKDVHDATALSWAALFGSHAITSAVLEAGGRSDIDSLDVHGRTPMVWASDKGHFDVVEVLLDAGAAVNPLHGRGQTTTALSAAASHGYVNIVDILLQKGADLSLPLTSDTDTGADMSPLCVAARNGKDVVVRHLLRFDAENGRFYDEAKRDIARKLAKQNGHGHVANTLKNVRFVSSADSPLHGRGARKHLSGLSEW